MLRGQQRQRIRQQFGLRCATAKRHVLAQRFNQGRNVRTPLAQRWHPKRQHIEPVKQVFAETPFPHQGAQVARRGGDHPRIKRDHFVRAQRLNLALLQGPQQLGLQTQGHVANLVQKQGATVGQFEFAHPPLAFGPGERAGRHAKKFGFEQGVGHCGNVDADQGPIGAAGSSMNRVRQQLFARAGFPQQEHGAVRLRGAAGLAFDLQCRCAGAYETGKAVFGTACAIGRLQKRVVALPRQLAPGVVQIALQQGEFINQRLQAGFGPVKQHDAQGANHLARAVAQRNAADHKGARPVRQQIDQDGFARLQHVMHLGVLHHTGDRVADKVFHPLKTQRRQKPLVLVIDPDHPRLPVHQQHALAGIGKQVEHGTCSQFQNALGVARQGISFAHGSMLARLEWLIFAIL